MKYLNLIIQGIIIAFLSGCSENNIDSTNTETINVDLDNVFSVNEIGLIDSARIIDLECGVLVGGADRVIRFESYIYILDSKKTQTVLIFDDSGNFINSIADIGNGPNEYAQLSDIAINSADTSLNLISRMDRKILKYSMDGGRQLSVGSLPKPFKQFFKTPQGYVGYMGNWSDGQDKSKNVSVLSGDLKIEHSCFVIDPTWESLGFGDGYPFSSFNDTVYYVEPLDFNIYSIGNEKVSIPHRFDFGTSAWPKDVKRYEEVKELMEKDRNRYIQRIYHFQETNGNLIAYVIHKGQGILAVYDKQLKKSKASYTDAYIGNYFIPFGDIIGFDSSAIYTLVDAAAMQRISVGKDKYNDFESKYPEQIKKLRAEFPHIKDDGNPFLVIYHIK